MATFDAVIAGGTVIDGTGMPRFRADIGIERGRIAALGSIRTTEADVVIDATDCIVAPGFVDLHTHYDAQLFWDPHCSISGWHGVTSVVIGNCGFGFAPVEPDLREYAMQAMTRNEAISLDALRRGLPWDWVTYPEFLASIDRVPTAVNVLAYVPLGPLLIYELGLDRAKAGDLPSEAEHLALERILSECLDAGACGWSVQRVLPGSGMGTQMDHDGTPMATDVMHHETCLRLASVLGQRREGTIQMTLKTGSVENDRAQFEDLARVSGRPVLFNTLGAVDRAPTAHLDTIAWLDSCRQQGLRVYAQSVTSTFGFTFTMEDFNLFDDSPSWREATIGSPPERLAKLGDPELRAALRKRRPNAATAGLDRVFLLSGRSPRTQPYENLSMSEVAAVRGCDVVDAFLDIAVADRLASTFHVDAATTSIDLISDIVRYPWAIPGISDGGAHTKFLTGGRYPTEFLIEYARDRDLLSLENAHWRLSTLPAMCAGIRDRGTLVIGAAADIVVYQLEHLEVLPMEVLHDLPGGDWRRVQRARGYRYVIVNGDVTLEDGHPTRNRPGHLLRHGSGAR